MDYRRAKEIIESYGVISVSYENAPCGWNRFMPTGKRRK